MSAGTIFTQLNTGDSQQDPQTRGRRAHARGIGHLVERTRSRLWGEESDETGAPAAPEGIGRYWSPLAAPVVLGAATCGAALLLTLRGVLPPSALLQDGGAPELLALALVLGALYGTLLYMASSHEAWLGTLLAGSVLYVAAILSAALGILPGILVVAAGAVVAFFYARRHLYRAPEGAITLTARRGHPYRTLYPGLNVLWPGERPLQSVEIGQRIFTSPPQRSLVAAPNGTRYQASSAVVVAYAIIPREGHRLAPALGTWEQDLKRLAETTLSDGLRAWGTQELLSGGAPTGAIASAVLETVRSWARTRGIWVAWVRVCHIHLVPAGQSDARFAAVSASRPRQAAHYANVGSRPARPAQAAWSAPRAPRLPAVSALGGDYPGEHYASSYPRAFAGGWGSPSQPSQPNWDAEDEPLSPEALADIYEAVREGRISDTETIRRLAQAFAEVAQSAELDEEVPYDATAAADILLDYAAQLERHHRTHSQPASQSHSGTYSWAPTALDAPTQDLR